MGPKVSEFLAEKSLIDVDRDVHARAWASLFVYSKARSHKAYETNEINVRRRKSKRSIKKSWTDKRILIYAAIWGRVGKFANFSICPSTGMFSFKSEGSEVKSVDDEFDGETRDRILGIKVLTAKLVPFNS